MERIKKLLRSDDPLTWVFYGDSITHGLSHTFGHRDYAELFAERVRYELGRAMDIIITERDQRRYHSRSPVLFRLAGCPV